MSNSSVTLPINCDCCQNQIKGKFKKPTNSNGFRILLALIIGSFKQTWMENTHFEICSSCYNLLNNNDMKQLLDVCYKSLILCPSWLLLEKRDRENQHQSVVIPHLKHKLDLFKVNYTAWRTDQLTLQFVLYFQQLQPTDEWAVLPCPSTCPLTILCGEGDDIGGDYLFESSNYKGSVTVRNKLYTRGSTTTISIHRIFRRPLTPTPNEITEAYNISKIKINKSIINIQASSLSSLNNTYSQQKTHVEELEDANGQLLIEVIFC